MVVDPSARGNCLNLLPHGVRATDRGRPAPLPLPVFRSCGPPFMDAAVSSHKIGDISGMFPSRVRHPHPLPPKQFPIQHVVPHGGQWAVRGEGNDEAMKEAANKNAARIGAGHTFIIMMKDAFPINVLNAVKMCQEVCTLYCATANPVEVILAQSEQGRGVLGVIDGSSPKGIEKEDGVTWRKELLRKFKYKL